MADNKLHLGFRWQNGNPANPTLLQQRAIDMFLNKRPKFADIQYLLLHGGSAGTKTATGVQLLLRLALENPGLDTLFGHVDLSSLFSAPLYHLFDQVQEEFKINGRKVKLWEHNQKTQEVWITIPGRLHPTRGYTMKVYYRPLDITKDMPRKLSRQGVKIGAALLDQIELLDEQAFHAILTRLAFPPYKVVATANPDVRQWYLRYFIDKDPDTVKKPESYADLIMLPLDNPSLGKEYVEALEANMPKALADRWIRGLYTTLEGLVYASFKYDKCVQRIQYPIPSDWHIYEVIDYGWSAPTAVQWWGVTPQNKHVLIDSIRLYKKTPPEIGATIFHKRDAILDSGRVEGAAAPILRRTLADPAIGSSEQSGKSIKYQLEDYRHTDGRRLRITLCSTKGLDRTNIVLARTLMAISKMSRDEIIIGENNTHFLSEMASYVWDDKSDKEQPYIFEVRSSQGVVHHFDHMKAFEYFESHVLKNYEEDVAMNSSLESDYGKNRRRTLDTFEKFDPLSRFRPSRN